MENIKEFYEFVYHLLPYKNVPAGLRLQCQNFTTPQCRKFSVNAYKQYMDNIRSLPDQRKQAEFIQIARRHLIDLLKYVVETYGFDDVIKLVDIMTKLIPMDATPFDPDIKKSLNTKFRKMFVSGKYSPSVLFDFLKKDIEQHIQKKESMVGGGQADPPTSASKRRWRRKASNTVRQLQFRFERLRDIPPSKTIQERFETLTGRPPASHQQIQASIRQQQQSRLRERFQALTGRPPATEQIQARVRQQSRLQQQRKSIRESSSVEDLVGRIPDDELDNIAHDENHPLYPFLNQSGDEFILDPVVMEDGETYERSFAEGWIRTCRQKRQPLTAIKSRRPIGNSLLPNLFFQRIFLETLKRYLLDRVA